MLLCHNKSDGMNPVSVVGFIQVECFRRKFSPRNNEVLELFFFAIQTLWQSES